MMNNRMRISSLAAKARYFLRDTVKVIGSQDHGLAPADAGLFFVNSVDPMKGGTGHTMRVCRYLRGTSGYPKRVAAMVGLKSILAVLFPRLWRPCPLQRAIKAARRHVAASSLEPSIELISDPAKISGYYLPQKGLTSDDCWFFHVDEQLLPGESPRVGASRVICLRRKDCAVVFDGYCGE